MKKYLKIFLVIIGFLFVTNVHAVTCNYKHISTKFMNSKKQKYESSEKYSFSYSTSSHDNIVFESCKFYDWYKKGTAYMMNEECPPYLSQIIDAAGGAVVNGAGEIFECKTFVLTDLNEFSMEKALETLNIDKNQATGLGYTEYKLIENKSNKKNTKKITKSCLDYGKSTCTTNDKFSCLWVTKKVGNKKVSYCNFDELVYVKCGGAWDIPQRIPGMISFLVFLLKIATPLILVFVSIVSLVKAVAASKEDEMKKAQNMLIRRLIAAGIVFFIIQITQFVVLKVADSSEKNNIATCMSCMLNNDCSKNTYYKTKVGSQYRCTYLNDVKNHDETCN